MEEDSINDPVQLRKNLQEYEQQIEEVMRFCLLSYFRQLEQNGNKIYNTCFCFSLYVVG